MDTMRVAATSGGAGDAIFGLKVMEILGVKIIYIKENFYPEGEGSLYANLKPLFEVNGLEVRPTSGQFGTWEYEPGLRYDHNMDFFREMPNRNKVHIILNQHRAFGLPDPSQPFKPWLKVDAMPSGLTSDVTLVNVTNRWRDGSRVNWRSLIAKIEGPKYFIGLKIDHERFESEAGPIEHFITKDFLEVARAIRDCGALYCNQGVCLAIAQGLGKDYWLEKKPRKHNVLTRQPNEHVLNPD